MKEKKKLFKSKLQMVIYFILFAICIVLFIVIGTKDYSVTKESEPTFSDIYNLVDKDNLYIIKNNTEIYDLMAHDGVFLFGFPKNEMTNYIAKLLNDVCKEEEIKEIYYYDFYEDRLDENGTYETIVQKLQSYLYTSDEGEQDIMAPSIAIIKNGSMVGFFDEASLVRGNIKPDKFLNEYEVGILRENIRAALKEYKGE